MMTFISHSFSGRRAGDRGRLVAAIRGALNALADGSDSGMMTYDIKL